MKYQSPENLLQYILRSGTKIQRSKSRVAIPGMLWGWEDFTTTRDAFFKSADLITSKDNGMTVVRIPMADGSVRLDGWQSIQFEFRKLGVTYSDIDY